MLNSSGDIEYQILEFGRDIFDRIGNSQPKVFDRNYVHSKLMEWSLNRPDFKNSLFRLVDVLPALQSSSAIGKHIEEYLSEPASDVNKVLGMGLKTLGVGSIPAFIAAKTLKESINQMASVFIAGKSPQTALPALEELVDNGLSFTVDLLGEYSLSHQESLAYLDRYLDALETIGTESKNWRPNWQLNDHPGTSTISNLSVKLTALYSQCNILNFERSVATLSERLSLIVEKAVQVESGLYIDAEDTAHNPIIYETFKNVFGSSEFEDFELPGLVLQAYAKDSESILYDLLDFAKEKNKKLAIRLVKGAYWDAETASSAQNYWPNPLFEDKAVTDSNYEKLTEILLDNIDICYPAFGSHNIRSLSHACCLAENKGINPNQFELQMLFGMARPIANAFRDKGYLVRLYVPLGELIPGMGYLVRRLLENTSNDSFLRHTFYESAEVDNLLLKPDR